MSLESKGFIATPADIRDLSVNLLAANTTAGLLTGHFLKAEVCTVQHELGAPPRIKHVKIGRLDEAGRTSQLAALDKVHEGFYAEVVGAMSKDLPLGKAKAIELNKRTNFARQAYSRIRRWVAEGNDITTLVGAKVTRVNLTLQHRAAKPPNARRLRKRTETQSKGLVATLLELGQADKAAALAELELLMGQLVAQFDELGGKPLSDPRLAAEQHRPFKPKGSSVVFMPTQTQVIRQQANPS